MKKKQLFLLLIIYCSFISLGLPDGVLGVAWPLMRLDFNQPLEAAGVIVLIMMPLSSFSSMMAVKLSKRFGVGFITSFSALLTSVSLLGIAFSNSFVGLIIFSVGLGIGQGAVDVVLNDVVAQNYSATHMTWLHGFWGVGATLGPAIMAWAIRTSDQWTTGYSLIGVLQLMIAVGLFLSVGLWKHLTLKTTHSEGKEKGNFKSTMIFGIALFFLYVGIEMSIGLWSNSYFVEHLNIEPSRSGLLISGYYLFITIGRFLSGFLTLKLKNRNMIRLGLLLAIVGITSLVFLENITMITLSLMLVGLGLAPLYPSMMHETPKRFNAAQASLLIGYQVAIAYVGGTMMSSFLGVVLARLSLTLLYPIMLFFLLLMLLLSEMYNQKT